jgi:OOP family OmpA-OmpF porin
VKKLTILSALFLTCNICLAQNLVPNGDFEQYSGCPNDWQQIDSALYWSSPIHAPDVIPEYYNQCYSVFQGSVGVPNNWGIEGFQYAHSGVGYAGIYIRSNIWPIMREYIEVPLTSTLNANACYHFEMYINLLNYSKYTSDDLGIYFSDTLISGLLVFGTLPFTPQINNSIGNMPDSLNWISVSGNYTATGGENYLLIGNFKNDSTTTEVLYNNSTIFDVVYIYIDDVSLTLCMGIGEQNENAEVKTYPNPFSDELNFNTSNNELSQIILYDITSRKIFNQSFSNSTSINIEQLAKGIYIYEVRNKNGMIKKGKVVKE